MDRLDEWQQKLTDDTYPLYTVSVVADLFEVDPQVIRRLEEQGIASPSRPSGNQRRYSRRDVERIAYALDLADDGLSRAAIARIVELEAEVASLRRQIDDARRQAG